MPASGARAKSQRRNSAGQCVPGGDRGQALTAVLTASFVDRSVQTRGLGREHTTSATKALAGGAAPARRVQLRGSASKHTMGDDGMTGIPAAGLVGSECTPHRSAAGWLGNAGTFNSSVSRLWSLMDTPVPKAGCSSRRADRPARRQKMRELTTKGMKRPKRFNAYISKTSHHLAYFDSWRRPPSVCWS